MKALAATVTLSCLTCIGVDAQPRRDFSKTNVCELVSGAVVAKAMNGTLAESRPFFNKTLSRCTYFVVADGKTSRDAFVVWIQAPEDFEELKQFIESPQTAVTGLGDGAYLFQDKGDGRFKITVLKKGDLMFQATADSAESARTLADAVVTELWKTPRFEDYPPSERFEGARTGPTSPGAFRLSSGAAGPPVRWSQSSTRRAAVSRGSSCTPATALRIE